MNKHLEELIKDMNIVVVMRFGSQLYGTDNENSDEDYKGIFIPSKSDIFLNKIPKSVSFNSGNDSSKNSKDDIDIELYSIHYFIELACKGETVSLDMLHCNSENIIINSQVWGAISCYKKKFYTNNLKGFVGYCRKQAAKYGIKGSRLSDARKVLNFLGIMNQRNDFSNYDMYTTMNDVWNKLPKGDHIHFVTGGKKDSQEEFYQVCGKKLQKTSKIIYCMKILEGFIHSYGHRALLAEKNEGIDWKAMSHALRCGYQIKELYKTNGIKFPLKSSKYLLKVKNGEIHYKKVAMCLEGLMDTIEKLSKEVNLPSKVNRKFWDKWLIGLIESELDNRIY